MPEIRKAKRALGRHQQVAAERMGVTQPKISGMMRGDFTNLSERKLMDCLNRLGYDVEINVRPAAKPLGSLTVTVAGQRCAKRRASRQSLLISDDVSQRLPPSACTSA